MPSVPIYDVLRSVPAVTALLGADPNLRVYAFGQAPTTVLRPYVTWQLTTGFPNNNLSDRPENDENAVQIDIYATTPQSAEAVKIALRDAIEPVTHITSWDGEGRETPTSDYRITFSVDWFVNR